MSGATLPVQFVGFLGSETQPRTARRAFDLPSHSLNPAPTGPPSVEDDSPLDSCSSCPLCLRLLRLARGTPVTRKRVRINLLFLRTSVLTAGGFA